MNRERAGTAVAAARAKVRPGWVLDEDAVAFSAIILVFDILLCYVLMLVKCRITIREQGVRGNMFTLAWCSNFGHWMEGERRMFAQNLNSVRLYCQATQT